MLSKYMFFESKMILKYFYFFILILSLSSCDFRKFVRNHLVGTAEGEFKKTLKNASPAFKRGWRDGCEHGISIGGNRFYQTFYRTNAINGYEYVSSSDYSTAWETAYVYCARYTYIDHKFTIWGIIFSGYL